MEKFPEMRSYEQEKTPTPEVSVPLVDVLRDQDQVERLWPEEADKLRPQVEKHVENARKISEYLDHLATGETTIAEKNRFYDAASELLNRLEQERIALFLPFESFPAPDEHSAEADQFRKSYLSAWVNILDLSDVRANFVDGDVLEDDARSEKPERVIKAAHLAPWLVKSDIINPDDVITLARDGGSELLSRGLLETTDLMSDMGLLSSEQATQLAELGAALPERPLAATPKYISAARQAWLDEKARYSERPTVLDSKIDLSAPLGERLDGLERELSIAKELAASLDPEQSYNVIWLGGSRLKGYSRDNSDLDLFAPTKVLLKEIDGVHAIPVEQISQDLPNHAHEVFDMAWVGESDRIEQLQQDLALKYFKEDNQRLRKLNTERLEQDLLEYRLLHKGYARLHPDTNPEYKKYTKMDGQSAFYETGYRIIATKIFASSVFIPQI